MMLHRLVLLAVLGWTIPLAGAGGKPNILFIFIDDLGWRDVGFNGSRYYETPHIDRIAREGMIFTDAYACGPN